MIQGQLPWRCRCLGNFCLPVFFVILGRVIGTRCGVLAPPVVGAVTTSPTPSNDMILYVITKNDHGARAKLHPLTDTQLATRRNLPLYRLLFLNLHTGNVV